MSDCAMVMEFMNGLAYGLVGTLLGGVILFIVITWLAKLIAWLAKR